MLIKRKGWWMLKVAMDTVTCVASFCRLYIAQCKNENSCQSIHQRNNPWREFKRPMITLLLKTLHSHRKLSWKWPFFFDNSSSTMECNPCYLLNSPPQSFNLLFSLDIATFCLNFEHFTLGPAFNEFGQNKHGSNEQISWLQDHWV